MCTCVVLPQVTGVGYNGAGEVLLDGESVHGFSCPSIGKIVEVSRVHKSQASV